MLTLIYFFLISKPSTFWWNLGGKFSIPNKMFTTSLLSLRQPKKVLSDINTTLPVTFGFFFCYVSTISFRVNQLKGVV